MTGFREVMYADTEENAIISHGKLCQLLIATNNQECHKYLDDWWKRRALWCNCFRQMPALRGHNTNNYAEATIRIFKDIGVNRVKQYNAISLMHAIMTTMESFYHSRLLEFAHNRNRLNVFKLRSIMEQISYVSKDAIIEGNCKGVFQVPSEHSENFYEVNAELGICQCRVGRNGSFCKHLCAVAYHFNVQVPNAPKTSDDDRYLAAKVAHGEDCPSKNFYSSFRNDIPIAGGERAIVHVSVNNNPNEMDLDRQVKCYAGNSTKESDKESCLRGIQETAALLQNTVTNLKDADWIEMGRSLNIFKQRLQNCSNASQLTTFFSTVGGGIPRLKRAGTMIGVQPTSKARRAANRSRGNRTLSYGRNAKAIQLLTRAKKQKASHNIAKNVRSNVNNYRKH